MNFLKYSLLRLAILVAVFVVCVLVGAGLIVAGIAAIVASFAISYIFFPRLHHAASTEFRGWISRSPKPSRRGALEDEQVEDSFTDRQAREQG